MRIDFDALTATWERLIAEDARIGFVAAPGDEARLEELLEAIEPVELALIGAPAQCEQHATVKLRIIGRAILGGAEACHGARLLDAARADLLRFPGARIAP